MAEMDKGAAYIAKAMSVQAKMYRILGWMMIVIGVPLLLVFGMGLIPIGLGWFCLRIAKKLEKRETIEEGLDGIAAVGASLAKRAKS